MNNYQCESCGGQRLSYQKYLKSLMPVQINENSHISYERLIIDHNNELPVEQGYVCQDCGFKLYHAGDWISTESQLKWFLTEDPYILAELEQRFEVYLQEQAEIMEEQEQEAYSAV